MSRSWCLPLWCVLVLCLRDVLAQPEDGCYSPGSIAGIVIATVVVTLVAAALAAAFAWYLWKQRKNGFGGEDKGAEKGPPMDKQLIVKENSDYAFDNPYFKDDETDHTKHDAAEKGESGYRLDNGNVTPSQNNTKANGQAKKNRPFSSLPFHAVFHPSGKKQQQQKATMDDTYISKAAERVEVPLRGHDFTGLGFDICGNMRDGIFVKDVLHRGPASESGKIKAGDRIVGVRVSFRAMVYEDALTILSYASPYDVRLELEKERVQSPPCPPATTGRRLLHPLYRSRSIDDLTQIDKHLGTDSPAIPSKSPKEATPKRSQSVEASNGGLKSRVAAFTLIKSKDDTKSRKSSTSSCDSASTKPSTTPLPEIAAEVKEEPVCVKKEIKSSRFRVEQINVKSEAPSKVSPPVKPARDLPEEKIPVKEEEKPQVVDAQPAAVEVDLPPPAEIIAPEDPPTAPPRKTGTPAKRRAPAPPPTETAALVHRAQEQPQLTEEAPPEDVPPPPPTSAVPSGDAVSLSGGEEAAPSSPGKRKAASLGDLTRLDTEAAAAASTVLERAVSLDLQQQSLPGENLGKQQKRILRAPAFQDDYMESKESDLDVQIIQENGLKRWENGLDSVLLPPLSNGHTEDDDEVATTSGMTIVTMTNDKTTITTPKDESGKDDEVTIVHPTVTPPLKKKILTIDLDLDTSSSSSSSSSSLPQLTSTPAQRKLETPPPEESSSTRVGPPLFAPVSVSIPVIKPDMTHFEKLPSPPGGRGVQLQSLYRPLFGEEQQPPLVANGGSSPPNSVAGFAKTLIVPGPNEVDSLLGLATEPDDQTLATEAKATLDVE